MSNCLKTEWKIISKFPPWSFIREVSAVPWLGCWTSYEQLIILYFGLELLSQAQRNHPSSHLLLS